jgi:nicotinate-nucleotide--dimethylbenzimidazole phosphoribosyltransferase
MDRAQIWKHLDSLAKPSRSLGRLEDAAVRLAEVQGTLTPTTRPRRLVLFAGDHGVCAQGVSEWPQEVTALMVGTILRGRAASSAFAAAHDCVMRVVDVGVASSYELPTDDARVSHRTARVVRGTRDLSSEPALSVDEFEAAWNVGAEEAAICAQAGDVILIAGEMGIGNTTPAACLTMLLADAPADVAVGRGAGASDATLERKRNLVSRAAERAAHLARSDIRKAIAAVSGAEIAAMAGFFAEGARRGKTLLLDGYVATAAALIAERLQPGTSRQMIAAHLSAEPGHRVALKRLGLDPLLDWSMRLGEGTGALVALPMLDSAAALLRNVASLAELGALEESPAAVCDGTRKL